MREMDRLNPAPRCPAHLSTPMERVEAAPVKAYRGNQKPDKVDRYRCPIPACPHVQMIPKEVKA